MNDLDDPAPGAPTLMYWQEHLANGTLVACVRTHAALDDASDAVAIVRDLVGRARWSGDLRRFDWMHADVLATQPPPSLYVVTVPMRAASERAQGYDLIGALNFAFDKVIGPVGRSSAQWAHNRRTQWKPPQNRSSGT